MLLARGGGRVACSAEGLERWEAEDGEVPNWEWGGLAVWDEGICFPGVSGQLVR
jgi:hypothetical protein